MGLLDSLPRGARLTDASWRARHRINTRVLWAHLPVLLLVGVMGPLSLLEAVGWPLLPVALAVASSAVRSTRARSDLTSLA